MKIYVASSWRNQQQPEVVTALRKDGHEVYDFRHPKPGNNGFHWSDVDPEWCQWSPERFVKALDHPIAKHGFDLDYKAMQWADACALVMPCGRSAHLEAGWMIGAGKPTVILLDEDSSESELMYRLASQICISLEDVVSWAKRYEYIVTNT